MKKQNLRSEAAIKRWLKIKDWKHVDYWSKGQPHVLELTAFINGQLTVVADIRTKQVTD